jgi:hypothetical protein
MKGDLLSKKYLCSMDTDTKTVSVDNNTITLINGRLYNESRVTDLLPNLFVISDSNNIVNKEIRKEVKSTTPVNNNKKKKIITETKVGDKVGLGVKVNNKVNNLKKIKKIKKEIIIDNTLNKNNFSWARLFILFISTVVIAGISAYLRIHGISIIFKIDLLYSAILVGGFVLSEFAIASLLLREIRSKLHAVLNFTILGIIQVILISMSFVFEFTTLSDWILVHKNKTELIVKQQTIVEDTVKDYDARIKSIQDQINITPDSYITKRSKLTAELNKLMDDKNKEKSKIETMLNNTATADKLTESNGMESAAKVLSVKDDVLNKGVLVVIAGILNLLYLFFIYGFMTEYKRRKS